MSEFDEVILDDDMDLQEVEVIEDKQEIVQTNTATPALSQGIKLDFGSISLPGIKTGNLGMKVSPYPVERLKFNKDNKAMISIVSDQVVAIKTHFSDECGSYVCFEGECCDKDGMPRVKYLLPAVVYDTDKTGRPISSNIDFGALSIGKDQYEELVTIQDLNGTLVGLDILVSCSDEQYQKLAFHTAGPARWMKKDNLVQQVQKFWSKNGKEIVKSTARVLTVAQWKEKNGAVQQTLSANDAFDDAFS